MCGIVGEFYTSLESGITVNENFLHLVEMMRLRGPDDEGTWTDGKQCVLGFRRLSILDLSPTGHQPMLTQDYRYALVFNGEIYNYREIRAQLETKGIRFRSTGDAEVVLYALAEWGIEALPKFNGMFALGFYDTQEKRLLIARDHAGIKPLYYLATPYGLVFASQYDQILSHPWRSNLPVSQGALALYLRLGYIPAPYAILECTHMLEAGAWLEFAIDGQVRRGKYFSFPQYEPPELYGEAAYEAVDTAITNAVRRHLISDVPVGIFLSGGIDSPLVAAKIREVTNSVFPTFTIGESDQRFDESQDASAYAKELGFEHILQHLAPQDALAILDDVVTACSEPFADYSIFPTMLVSKLARQHVKVVLSGDGGDELFWGYVPRFAAVLERSKDFKQPVWVRNTRRYLTKYLRIGSNPTYLTRSTIGDWYLDKHTRSLVKLKPPIFPDLPLPRDFNMFSYAGWQEDQTAQWLRWNEYVGHLTMVLLKVDRASMFNSLEVRVPYLDREVIEVATRIDWPSCLDIQAKIGKIPLRKALSKRIKHQSQNKRGFDIPMDTWLRTSLRPLFEEYVGAAPELLGVPLNQGMVRTLYDQHLSGKFNHDRSLWVLLSLALWEKNHYRASRERLSRSLT